MIYVDVTFYHEDLLLKYWRNNSYRMVINKETAKKYYQRTYTTKSNVSLKSATKPFNVLLACACPLISEFVDNLKKYSVAELR